MIVTCPNCTANYRVRNESVPPEGARMRCPKCSTLFLALAPKGAPPDPVAGLFPAPPHTSPSGPGVPAPRPGPAGASFGPVGATPAFARPPPGAAQPSFPPQGPVGGTPPFAQAPPGGPPGQPAFSQPGVLRPPQSSAATDPRQIAQAIGAPTGMMPVAQVPPSLAPQPSPLAGGASDSGIYPPMSAPDSAGPFAPDPFAPGPSIEVADVDRRAVPSSPPAPTPGMGEGPRSGIQAIPLSDAEGAGGHQEPNLLTAHDDGDMRDQLISTRDDPYSGGPGPAMARPVARALNPHAPARPQVAARRSPPGVGSTIMLGLSLVVGLLGLAFAGWTMDILRLDPLLLPLVEEHLEIRPPRSFLGHDDPHPQALERDAAAARAAEDLAGEAMAYKRLLARQPDHPRAAEKLEELARQLGRAGSPL